MLKDYSKHRNAAISWMNSSRNFNEGIAILEASGFRPAVVSNLKKRGIAAPSAMSRLKYLMRSLISAWAKPGESFDDTDINEGIINGDKNPLITDGTDSPVSMIEAYDKLMSGQLDSYPENIKNIITTYRNTYVQREILHRELTEMGEVNDDETCAKRQEKSQQIDELSQQMDTLYPQFIAFVRENKLPDADTQKQSSELLNDENVPYSEMSVDELKKLKKSLATKVLRAENRLKFQRETKADTPNPMPDGAERVKYETKIRKLSEEIEAIKMEIATRG